VFLSLGVKNSVALPMEIKTVATFGSDSTRLEHTSGHIL
jgi:hypothetical protein